MVACQHRVDVPTFLADLRLGGRDADLFSGVSFDVGPWKGDKYPNRRIGEGYPHSFDFVLPDPIEIASWSTGGGAYPFGVRILDLY